MSTYARLSVAARTDPRLSGRHSMRPLDNEALKHLCAPDASGAITPALKQVSQRRSEPCGSETENQAAHRVERCKEKGAGTQRREGLPFVGGESAVGAD